MPVRIYEIARRLGVPSKEVLAKAKDLGIGEARVASSSLDKITAEFLEEQMGGGPKEEETTPPPAPVEEHGPVVIISQPEPEEIESPAEPAAAETEALPAEATAETETETETTGSESVPEPEAETLTSGTEPTETEPEPEITADEEPEPEAPVAEEPTSVEEEPTDQTAEDPAEDEGPKVGDKVGFIQLSSLTASRGRGGREAARKEKAAKGKPDPKAAAKGRTAPQDKFVAPKDGPVISLKAPIVVRDLAEQLEIKPFKLIADLMEMGVFANVNQSIEELIAKKACAKYGFRFDVEKRAKGEGQVHAPKKKEIELDSDDKPEDLRERPPVVTIMGHVDHGKTTLLDVIRKTNVVDNEAGKITQHIGAYTISIPHPERPKEIQQITFLDTPGHEAFSAMRARGANVTDIVVLVVAANDGIMPQTLEALNHAKAAEVPIIVAVNKCDHPNANPTRVRQQMQEKGVVCEEWGGETIFQDVSALSKEGVDKLLELILLQAEILELKANPTRRASGNVVESGVEAGGPTGTLLIRKGTLKVGDAVLCGPYWGRVRALVDAEGKRLKEAGPSVAVKVLGLNGAPEAGSEFVVVENEKAARQLGEERAQQIRHDGAEKRSRVTLENLFDTLADDQNKALKVVVKADTQGSSEAIVEALAKIDSSKVQLDVIHSAVGTISESDVLLASASDAVILGFHAKVDSKAAAVAKNEGVQVKLYTIIYELIDEVKDAMAGLLEPELREIVTGAAEVRQIFSLSKGGNVAGCMVSSGRVAKGRARVKRKDNVLFGGTVHAIRRFQDEVNEVRAGLECGIRLDGFDAFEEGDVIECYNVEKVPQKL